MSCCKPCKNAGLKDETSNEMNAGCGCEFNRVRPLSYRALNRPPLRTNMKLIERTHSNRYHILEI